LKVERAADPGDVPCGDMGVDLGRGEAGVPEQLLNVANVDAVPEEVGGEGVSQRVRRDPIAEVVE
jgi:hypothetical protein